MPGLFLTNAGGFSVCRRQRAARRIPVAGRPARRDGHGHHKARTRRGNSLNPRLPRRPWRRPSPSPKDDTSHPHRPGLKGPASARPPLGGRFSPARSGAGLSYRVPTRLGVVPCARAGARQCLAIPRPTVGCVFTRTTPRPPWRRPSPSPPRTICKRHRTGLKGPASACPGRRFSPAGAGAGLCHCVPYRLRLNRPARAGARRRLAFSRPEEVATFVANVGCVFTRTTPATPSIRTGRPRAP